MSRKKQIALVLLVGVIHFICFSWALGTGIGGSITRSFTGRAPTVGEEFAKPLVNVLSIPVLAVAHVVGVELGGGSELSTTTLAALNSLVWGIALIVVYQLMINRRESG